MEKILLKSIIDHTSSILSVSNIKISTNNNDMLVHAISDDDLIYCYLTYNKPSMLTVDDVFGLNRLPLLAGMVKSDVFDKVDLIRKADNTAAGLIFKGGKNKSSYRVVSKHIVESTFQKVPTLKDINYEIIFSPTAELIRNINQFSNLFSSVSSVFTITVDGGAVLFNYGEDDNANIHVADTENTYDSKFMFNCVSFTSLLKLASSHTTFKVKISSLGAIVIYAEDTIGDYTYVLRATK